MHCACVWWFCQLSRTSKKLYFSQERKDLKNHNATSYILSYTILVCFEITHQVIKKATGVLVMTFIHILSFSLFISLPHHLESKIPEILSRYHRRKQHCQPKAMEKRNSNNVPSHTVYCSKALRESRRNVSQCEGQDVSRGVWIFLEDPSFSQ